MEITVEMVERLREKAPVSYAQAKEALEYSEGNLLDALIYLEEKGAIPQAEGTRWSGREEKESQPTAAELVVQETPEPGKKKYRVREKTKAPGKWRHGRQKPETEVL